MQAMNACTSNWHLLFGPAVADAMCYMWYFAAAQILYYDGQFDDARLNVTLACTAAAAGGAITNYVEAQQLIKVCS